MKKQFAKKIFCFVMCFVFCFCLAACGDDKGKNEPKAEDPVTTQPAVDVKDNDSKTTESAIEPEQKRAREHIQKLKSDIVETREYHEYDVLNDDEYLKHEIFNFVKAKGEELAGIASAAFQQNTNAEVIGVFRVPNGIISESDSGVYVYRVDYGFIIPAAASKTFSPEGSFEYDGTYVRFKNDYYCYFFRTTEYETGNVITDELIFWQSSDWIDDNCYTQEAIDEYGNRYEAAAFEALKYYNEVMKPAKEYTSLENKPEDRDAEAKTKIIEYFGGEYEISTMEYVGSVPVYEGAYTCYHVDGDYIVLQENTRYYDSDPYFGEVSGLMPAIEVSDYYEAVYNVVFGISDVQAAICYEPYGFYAEYGAMGMFFGNNDYYYGNNNKKLDWPVWEGGSAKDYYYTEGVNHLYNVWYHWEDADGNSFEYFIKSVALKMAKTYRGITFGDTKEKVMELYPEINLTPNAEIDEDRDYMWYAKYPEQLGGDVLVIVFENEKVVELQSVHLYGYE